MEKRYHSANRNIDDGQYRTRDLAESAFLLAKGQRLASIDRNGQTCWFIFPDRSNCEKLANDFWFGDSTVPAKAYYEAIQTLKNRIFSV